MNDSLLATGHIALWLLFLGLFLPRLALFLAWFGVFSYPPNPLPDLLNCALWLVVPRLLMAYYVYINLGLYNLWFLAYLVLGIVSLFGEGGYVHGQIRRRTTTVTQNGHTTTTVEEEEID